MNAVNLTDCAHLKSVLTCRQAWRATEPRPGSMTSLTSIYPDKALYAQDQWQGRALHPDTPAGMGLCHPVHFIAVQSSRPAALAVVVQSAAPTW
jgi:hypothetical protein